MTPAPVAPTQQRKQSMEETTVRMTVEEAKEAAARAAAKKRPKPEAAAAPPAQARLPAQRPTPAQRPAPAEVPAAQVGPIAPPSAPESAKFELEPPGKIIEPVYPAQPRELPEHYDATRLVLLVRDPEWVFAYWEISRADQQRLLAAPGKAAELALRIHDVTTTGGATEGASHFDVAVGRSAGTWHIRLPRAGRAWRAELGLLGAAGEFRPIAASNPVGVPRDVAAAWSETSRWVNMEQEAFEEIFRLSGGEAPLPTRAPGSSEAARPAAPPAPAAVPPVAALSVDLPKIGASELTSRMQ